MNFDNLSKEDINKLNNIFFKYDKVIPNDIDIILVLGGNKLNRAISGIEVYRKIKKPILFSGGFKKKDKSEADTYKDYALKEGVLERDIIVENNSLNTYNNFELSFPIILEAVKKDFVNVLVVTSSIHMVRSLIYGNKVIKENKLPIKIYPYPGDGYDDISNWFKDKNKKEFLKEELEKLIIQKHIKL